MTPSSFEVTPKPYDGNSNGGGNGWSLGFGGLVTHSLSSPAQQHQQQFLSCSEAGRFNSVSNGRVAQMSPVDSPSRISSQGSSSGSPLSPHEQQCKGRFYRSLQAAPAGASTTVAANWRHGSELSAGNEHEDATAGERRVARCMPLSLRFLFSSRSSYNRSQAGDRNANGNGRDKGVTGSARSLRSKGRSGRQGTGADYEGGSVSSCFFRLYMPQPPSLPPFPICTFHHKFKGLIDQSFPLGIMYMWGHV